MVTTAPRHRTYERLLLLTLTFLAFVLRVYWLSYQSLWRDEIDALRFATQPLPDLLSMFTTIGQNGPLYFLGLRPWVEIAGRSEFALRFPSAWAGTLVVPLVYVLVRRLAGRRAAAVAALLMAISSYLVWYGQETKMYATLVLLVAAALWLASQIIHRGGWWRWVLLYVLTGALFFIHLLAVLAVPVIFTWLLLAPAPDTGAGRAVVRRRLGALVYLAALVLPYLPLARWEIPVWLSGNTNTGYAFVPLPNIYSALLAAFGRGILPTQSLTLVPASLALLAGLLLYGMARGREGWRSVAMAGAWLILPPIGVFLISINRPIFLERYLIWVVPAMVILAALGIVVTFHIWKPAGLALFAVICAFNLADIWQVDHQLIKADFRDAAAYVEPRRTPGDVLLFQIPYNHYTYEYYSGSLGNWAEGPYTNNGMQSAELDQWMVNAIHGARDVWLIDSEADLWDRQGMYRAWLDSHGTIVDRHDFTGVSVVHYQLTSVPAKYVPSMQSTAS